MSCDDQTNYSYSSYIATPKSLGISDKGSTAVLGKDIDGLIAYTEILTTGGGEGFNNWQTFRQQVFYDHFFEMQRYCYWRRQR